LSTSAIDASNPSSRLFSASTSYAGPCFTTVVTPSRLVAAQNAASDFVRQLPSEFRVGLVSFSGVAQVLATPTTDRAAAALLRRSL